MTKSTKILSLLFIILLFTLNISLATDINMNLDPIQDSSNAENVLEEENLVEDFSNEIIDEEEDSTSTSTPSTTISTLSSVPDEGLSLTNILNILLIVVGVVLILLGIAILIRIHS